MESRLLSASFSVLSLISVGLLAVDGSLVFAAGPKFQALKKSSVSVDGGLSRGVSWGDFDNDGDLDLFVANGTEDTDEIEDFGIGYFLYLNRGDGTFESIRRSSIVTDLQVSTGTGWSNYE